MLDQSMVQKVLSTALRSGGDFAEVFVEDKRASSAMYEDGRVDGLSSGLDRGAGVRVVIGETTGYAHTADLTEPGLLAAAEAASAVARLGGTEPRIVALNAQPSSRPYDVEILPETIGKEAKVALLKRAEQAARGEGAAIRQVMAGYGDSRRRTLIANSDGVWAEDDVVRTRFVVQAVAEGDTGLQMGYRPAAFTMGWELFDKVDVEELGREAAQMAITKLRARPAPSGVLPVVLKHGSGGILFHEACGHGLEADAVLKEASMYAGRLGQQVASPLVTLVDDGTVGGGEWGSFSVDDEGKPASRNVLIEDGILTDYMWDFLRARKEGRQSSGNGRRETYQHLPMVRMTNTFLLDGTDDADEIVAQTPNGVYVAQLGGGSVDTTTGDFVFGMTEAYLIEDGQITEPLRDANLIGNGPDVMTKIDAVANDFAMTPGTCGKDGQSVPVGTGQPTLRITAVTIGGTAGA